MLDPTKRHTLVGQWIWEYDGDDPYPARMYWCPPPKNPEPVVRWCRMPWCDNDAVNDEFCSTHSLERRAV